MPLDPQIGDANTRLFRALRNAKDAFDPATGKPKAPYLQAFSLLTAYTTASRSLSTHLHPHRC